MWKKMKTKCKEFLSKKTTDQVGAYAMIAIFVMGIALVASTYTHSIIAHVIEAIVADIGAVVMVVCMLEAGSRTQKK